MGHLQLCLCAREPVQTKVIAWMIIIMNMIASTLTLVLMSIFALIVMTPDNQHPVCNYFCEGVPRDEAVIYILVCVAEIVISFSSISLGVLLLDDCARGTNWNQHYVYMFSVFILSCNILGLVKTILGGTILPIVLCSLNCVPAIAFFIFGFFQYFAHKTQYHYPHPHTDLNTFEGYEPSRQSNHNHNHRRPSFNSIISDSKYRSILLMPPTINQMDIMKVQN